MAQTLTMSVAGALGTNAGAASDGVLSGQIAQADPTKALLKTAALTGFCITKDDTTFVDETTPWGEGTADDVEILPSTPAVGDAVYFGATTKFGTLSMDITTAAVDPIWTVVWEYWDGTAYVATLSETDNTTQLKAATGDRTVVFTPPTDWAKNTVLGVNAFWIRARVSAFTSVTTEPQVGSGHVILATSLYTDDLTDFTDVGTADVILLPVIPTVGDGFYIGYSERFCKAKVTTSTARTGTATVGAKYWNGAWTAIPAANLDDDTVGWSTTAGTLLINFIPPSDWVANTAANGPNGQAGWFIVMELTALTTVTANPVATQGWVLPLKTGASGIKAPVAFSTFKLAMSAQTKSGTAADSEFLVINTTTGAFANITWTKGDPFVEDTASLVCAKDDEIALVQVREDGSTEFADADFTMTLN